MPCVGGFVSSFPPYTCQATRADRAMTSCRPHPSDRNFGLLVEEMNAIRIDRESQLLVHLSRGRRLDRCDQRQRSCDNVEQNLRTKSLNHFDRYVKAQVAHLSAACNG